MIFYPDSFHVTDPAGRNETDPLKSVKIIFLEIGSWIYRICLGSTYPLGPDPVILAHQNVDIQYTYIYT